MDSQESQIVGRVTVEVTGAEEKIFNSKPIAPRSPVHRLVRLRVQRMALKMFELVPECPISVGRFPEAPQRIVLQAGGTSGIVAEDEPTLPTVFFRQEVTDPAFADTPSLSVSPDADLMTQIVDPENLSRAWSRFYARQPAQAWLGPPPDSHVLLETAASCTHEGEKPCASGVKLDMAIEHAMTRKSDWRLSRTPAMRFAIPNPRLHEQLGLLSLKQLWCDLATHLASVHSRNRLFRIRTIGGVGERRGQPRRRPGGSSCCRLLGSLR